MEKNKKPVFEASDQVRLKQVCTAMERLARLPKLCIYRDQLLYLPVKNKGTDQTAQLCSLVCAFVVHMQQIQVFSH